MLDSDLGSVQCLQPMEIKREVVHRIMRLLRQEFPPSTTLIRDKMRKDLGFTFREHLAPGDHRFYVDFFNSGARSWFLIRFAEILDQK